MEMSKLAPAFAKLAEAAQEISEIFAAAGGVTLGKRGPGALLLDADGKPIKKKKARSPRAHQVQRVYEDESRSGEE